MTGLTNSGQQNQLLFRDQDKGWSLRVTLENRQRPQTDQIHQEQNQFNGEQLQKQQEQLEQIIQFELLVGNIKNYVGELKEDEVEKQQEKYQVKLCVEYLYGVISDCNDFNQPNSELQVNQISQEIYQLKINYNVRYGKYSAILAYQTMLKFKKENAEDLIERVQVTQQQTVKEQGMTINSLKDENKELNRRLRKAEKAIEKIQKKLNMELSQDTDDLDSQEQE